MLLIDNMEIKSKINSNKEKAFILILVILNTILIWNILDKQFPYVFSAPLIPMLVDVVRRFGVDIDISTRIILLSFFILSPVTLYFLVREATGRKMTAALAALVYSLPIFSSRFESMMSLGDGAHVASLTFIPIACFWLLRFLKTGKYINSITASFWVLIVSLTSPFGLFVLLGMMAVITFSEMLLGSGRMKFMRLVWVLAAAAGLSAFWYNPAFIQINLASTSGRAVMAAVKNLIPISFVVLPVLATFGYLIFDKRDHLQPLFIALGMTILFGLISFAGRLAPFAVSAQQRYLSELGLAIAFLWGVVGVFVYDLVDWLPESEYFPVARNKRSMIQRAMIVVLIAVSLVLVIFFPYELGIRERERELDEGVKIASVYEIRRFREKASSTSIFAGYAISALTVGGLGFVYRYIKRYARESES